MATSTPKDHAEERDLIKRQKCNNGVPISTHYEVSTIATRYVSYSYYTSTPRSSNTSETTKPTPISRVHYTFTFEPRPPISIITRTSTTQLPPKKSVVSTTSDIIPKARAVHGVPITITQTHITSVPVETIYSCPPTSHETPTSRDDHSTSRNTDYTSSSIPERPTSRELPTSWIGSTSHSSREPPTSWTQPTSRPTTATESIPHPSTESGPTTSLREPWYPSSSTPSVVISRPSLTSTLPPLTPTPHPPSTRPTSIIPPPTSSVPNSTITLAPRPPITTHSYSQCVYTLFDGTYPYSSYTTRCSDSTTSESLCTSFYRNGEWDLAPCTSTSTNTNNTTSTLTNTTTSTQTITSWLCSSYISSQETWIDAPCTSSINVTASTWPCSSYATSLQQWVPGPCTSTTPNFTTPLERCSSFMRSSSGWATIPCTSTPNIKSIPTITTPPTVTITPIRTHIRSCSTYVEDLKTWLPMPCDFTMNTPTISTVSGKTITHNTTMTITITRTSNFTETLAITTRPTVSHSQLCSTYFPQLELWISAPCTTTAPTLSICLDRDQDARVPCASVTHTSDTDTWSLTSEVTDTSSPVFVTVTHPPHTFDPTATFTQTDESTSTGGPTRAPETWTHTPTRLSSGVTLGTSEVHSPTETPHPIPPATTSSQESLGTSQGTEPSITRETTTVGGSTGPESIQPVHTSSRLSQSSTSPVLFTSNFIVPSTTGVFFPSPSSTLTPIPDGIRGGTLAGIIIGGILGVVGLLGIGAFIMKSFGGYRDQDIFEPRGAYQAASSGASVGGRDGGGGGGVGSSNMSEVRNESPRRSALRNRNDAGGGWSDASWASTHAYTGVATAAVVAAAASNNQRGRGSDANGRYADGGIRDEDTPDRVPHRYGDGGLAGPDSHYDTGMVDHPYGTHDPRHIVSSLEVQFDPYHDLPGRHDSVPVGANIARQSALTGPEIAPGPPGPTAPYQSTPAVTEGYPSASLQPGQADSGVFVSGASGQSTTSFAPSTMDQPLQPHPNNMYQTSPPYTENSGAGGVVYRSPEPLASTDIQRPPYWESSIPAASVDSLPQHDNIPRYSALVDVGNDIVVVGSPASGFDDTAHIGSAPALAPGIGSTSGIEGVPRADGPVLTNPTWNPVGVTEFGQDVIGSPSPQIDGAAFMAGSAVPDAPRGLYQGLARLSTEGTSTQRRDTSVLSPVSASGASLRPPKVGGPRARPPRSLPSRESMARLDSRRSLPPAYEE
ncbi:unnamed protein product [Rhizoctonia solani]|uniref:Uncharacterized protein n=1 Tax=Rhizoctonia solani TaxID=456999 RepID=A0A8H2WZ69_9AGAM|nr:unnamed protein product [Rhizoctonia solani]